MEDPETINRWASITTQFPGASADRVESLVTDKIASKLLEIEEIGTIDSFSFGCPSRRSPVLIINQLLERLNQIVLLIISSDNVFLARAKKVLEIYIVTNFQFAIMTNNKSI